MEIRSSRASDDRLAVSRVYEESWRSAYRALLPQDYLDALPRGRWAALHPGLRELVALDGDQLVGVCCYCPSRISEMDGWGEIVSLYVLPSHTGQGFGRALFAAALAALRTMGFDRVFLWVLEGNETACRFYEQNGFRPSGYCLEDTIGGQNVRELQYVRPEK